tara:strand:+ start:428354 stop:429046 length:693 start_codon:yes stop_codon:yes gene_type:complete
MQKLKRQETAVLLTSYEQNDKCLKLLLLKQLINVTLFAMKIVFATNNQNKLDEVKLLIPQHINLLSLQDIGCNADIEESATTLEGNAQLKADYVTTNFGYPCFADDTGLLVASLNGEPGVLSARYAGEQKSSNDNMDKLLTALKDKKSRAARFKTVIALNLEDQRKFFTGIVEGEIIHSKKGTKGFGYDPIFRPNGYNKTFAELSLQIKNSISHRGQAIKQLIDYLESIS